MEQVASLPDPVGQVISRWQRPNGLDISRIRTPIGVIGMIYESRPNVTADAAAICIRSGNAIILRSGSDGLRSALAIHGALAEGRPRPAQYKRVADHILAEIGKLGEQERAIRAGHS